ncbi:unnamed protein product [Clonostachys solani]|uniref:Uncharacterized protein n=1 Tax=Clonostachys solani TaxID=160281 RepID=A0A9N9ZNW8_9HYPO|nr:unnamed protein product [Clonostachys solani]
MSQDIQTLISNAKTRQSDLKWVLSKTEHAEPSLKKQLRLVREAEARLSASDHKLQSLEAQRLRGREAHERHRDSSFKRMIYTAAGQRQKFQNRVEEEEKTYLEVLHAEQEEYKLNETLKLQLNGVLKVQSELEDAESLHQRTQRQLEELYEEIFAGPTPEFPDEDVAEREAETFLQVYHDTHVRHDNASSKLDLVNKAREEADAALLELMRARVAFEDGQLDERFLPKVQQCLQKAASSVNLAKENASKLQLENIPRPYVDEGSFMYKTEFIFQSEIRQTQVDVSELSDFLRNAAPQIEKELNQVNKELPRVEIELERARKNLLRMRETIFETVAEEGTAPLYTKS